MSDSQSCCWNPIRRAGNVGDTNFLEEWDGSRIAPDLTADADRKFRLDLTPFADSYPHQFTNTGLVDTLERIKRKDFFLLIMADEFSNIVP